ncbi:hypothetical protein LXL04_007568 [Taraxacum kok-saghyz]
MNHGLVYYNLSRAIQKLAQIQFSTHVHIIGRLMLSLRVILLSQLLINLNFTQERQRDNRGNRAQWRAKKVEAVNGSDGGDIERPLKPTTFRSAHRR